METLPSFETMNRLVTLCREHDDRYHLHLLPATSEALKHNPHRLFTHHVEGELVGLARLLEYDEGEICVLVHPNHRRQGVGRKLIQEVLLWSVSQGKTSVLLVQEGEAQEGEAFAKAVGGEYTVSEYEMEYTGAVPQPTSHTPSIILRSASESDMETLITINAQAFGDTQEVSRLSIAKWMAHTEMRFYVGTIENTSIGCLRVTFDSHTQTAYINSFGVLPEVQGRGYGRQILTQVVCALKSEGCYTIRLEVETENRNALGLYRSCGFEIRCCYAYYRIDC